MDIAKSQIVFFWILSYHRFGVQTVFTHAISGHIYMKKQPNIKFCVKIESNPQGKFQSTKIATTVLKGIYPTT